MASFASSYIKTETVAVTRNSDVLSYVQAGNYNNAAGSAYAEVTVAQTQSAYGRCISCNGASEGLLINTNGLNATFYDGTNIFNSTTQGSVGVASKYAINWAGVVGNVYCNGAGKVSGAYDGSLLTGTNIEIGGAGGVNNIFGAIKNVRIYPRALSDAKLTEMTS